MILTVHGPATLDEYVNSEEPVRVERPGHCPRGCPCPMQCHTGYTRGARCKDGCLVEVEIQRFRCGRCTLVVSCLFDFLVPYVIHTVQAIAAWVGAYGMEPVTYDDVPWVAETPESPRSTVFRRVAACVRQAERVRAELQTEAMLACPELVEMDTVQTECPNSWKAWAPGKSTSLDCTATLLETSKSLLREAPAAPAAMFALLHRYFMTTAEHLKSIFFQRKDLALSNQQSLRCPIF